MPYMWTNPLPDGDQKCEDYLRSAGEFYSCLSLNTKQNDHISALTSSITIIIFQLVTYSTRTKCGYGFGVCSCSDNQASMYCSLEGTARWGSDEVISCLDLLCLYLDGCGGYNKNSNVMRYLFMLVSTGQFLSFRHMLPVWGHSFLLNDRDFSLTELKKRSMRDCTVFNGGWASLKRPGYVSHSEPLIVVNRLWSPLLRDIQEDDQKRLGHSKGTGFRVC